MEKKQSVIGIGEALFDVLPEGKKLGGAPANFAYHVSQFGLNSCAVSAMGDDELGKELEKELNDHHLNYQIDKVAYPTGTVQVSLDANGIPCYDIKEGAAWDNIPYTPALEKLAKDCTAACFGSLAQRNEVSRNTIYRFLDHMPKGEGILKIFDINLRQGFYNKDIITESIKRCNILKINDEELITVSRPGEQMLAPPGQVQSEDAHPYLRCKRQLRVHPWRSFVYRDSEGGSGRHSRCR